jgi:Fe-S-cluster containining protein
VFVNTAERSDIGDLLELSQEELIESYFVQDQGKCLIQQVKVVNEHQQQQDEDERCIFLTSDKKCSIYQARPTQCRTFPFWPHIVASSYDWQRSQRDCEGIRISEDNSSDEKNHDGETIDDNDHAVASIPISTIWNNLLVHTVHRGGIEESATEEEEDSTMTYTQMIESLPSFLDDDMLHEFQQDYLQQYQREIVYESQDLWVVDTLGSGWQAQEEQQQQDFQPTRSLVFRNSPSLTQSEMAITRSEKDAPTATRQVDHTTLLLDVHQVMARIVQAWDVKLRSLLSNSHASAVNSARSAQHFAVLGTGAGALPLWLHGKYPNATIDCVEASSEVLQVAQDYFGFGTSSTSYGTLRSYCQRGEDYLMPSAEENSSFGPESSLLDLLVVDVAAGMEIPPRLFFEADLLQSVKNRLVSPHGMVIWNVRVSSSSTLEWERMLTTLRDAFPYVHVEPVSSTNFANRIVYASNDPNFLKDSIIV